MISTDPFDLERFVEAQRQNYGQAVAELRAGHKRNHWSWYVFPQLRGLGSSPMSVRYAISGLAEARAYLDHTVLGPRVVECVAAMRAHRAAGPESVLGDIDAKKFHSCCTLLSRAASQGSAFHEALDVHFAGRSDERTLSLLGGLPPQHGTPARLPQVKREAA
jgi:uncharacterized protein (DUF1810 family)